MKVAIRCGAEACLGKVAALPFWDDEPVEPGNGRHFVRTTNFDCRRDDKAKSIIIRIEKLYRSN